MTKNLSTSNNIAKRYESFPASFRSDLDEFMMLAEELLQLDQAPTDFAALELGLVEDVTKLGLGLLKAIIEKMAEDAPSSIERKGRSWHRLAPTKGSLICLLGRVDYTRCRYRCGGERNSICPVDEKLGLLEGTMTRPAGHLAMRLVSELPPRICQEFFQQAGGMDPSVSTLQRVLQETHWAWRQTEQEALAGIRAVDEIPKEAKTVAVSLDGAMVQLRPGEYPIGTGGCQTQAGPNWREAACGTISFHDKEGKKLKTISSGRMPEKNKLALKHWLAQELEASLRKRPDLTFVTVADGAPDNWSFLTQLAPEEEILDFYHACEHLHDAAQYAQSKTSWFSKWRHLLRHDHDGVERVIGAIRGLRDRAQSETERTELDVILTYFRTHRHRMNYAALRAKGLPIGSGIVEAANKNHIGERLKKSGMRWSMEGGQAVLSFRSLVKSNRFDQAWKWILKEIHNRNPDNDNWKQYYEKKAA